MIRFYHPTSLWTSMALPQFPAWPPEWDSQKAWYLREVWLNYQRLVLLLAGSLPPSLNPLTSLLKSEPTLKSCLNSSFQSEWHPWEKSYLSISIISDREQRLLRSSIFSHVTCDSVTVAAGAALLRDNGGRDDNPALTSPETLETYWWQHEPDYQGFTTVLLRMTGF